MLVKMRKQIGGYRNLEPWPAVGGVVDVPDHEARDLIANGYAVAYTEEPDATTGPADADATPAEDSGDAPAGDADATPAENGDWFDVDADPVAEPAPKRSRAKG